jgi:hypothetical protein
MLKYFYRFQAPAMQLSAPRRLNFSRVKPAPKNAVECAHPDSLYIQTVHVETARQRSNAVGCEKKRVKKKKKKNEKKQKRSLTPRSAWTRRHSRQS